jgi:hypothetical protein
VVLRFALAIWASAGYAAFAGEPLAVSHHETASVEFTLETSPALQDLKNFTELQRAAGASGILAGHVTPYQRCHWKGSHAAGDINAIVFRGGDFRAVAQTSACSLHASCSRLWESAIVDCWDCDHPANQ